MDPKKVYDEDDNLPINRPDLRAQEEAVGPKGPQEAGGPARAPLPSTPQSSPPSELSSMESSAQPGATPSAAGELSPGVSGGSTVGQTGQASAGTASQAPGQASSGLSLGAGAGWFRPGGSKSPLGQLLSRVFGFFGRNKKKTIAGGAVGITTALIGVFGFGGLVNLELVNMEKNLLRYESKIEQHFEQKGAQREFQKIVDKLRNKSTQAADEAAGGELTKGIYSFDITDPALVDYFKEQGLQITTDNVGKFTGIKDVQTGQDVTDKVGSSDVLFDKLNQALPEWKVAQISDFRQVVLDHSGAAETGIPPDEAPDKVEEQITDDIEFGANADGAYTPVDGAETDTPPSSKTPVPGDSFYGKLKSYGGALSNAITKANEVYSNGGSATEAVKAGVDSFAADTGTQVTVAGILTILCSVYLQANSLSQARVPEMMNLLIRHGVLLISLADELKTGDLKSGEVNQIMQLFNGDAPRDRNSKIASDHKDYTSSATWQRATGGKVNLTQTLKNGQPNPAYTPQSGPSSLPVENSATQIINAISSIIGGVGLAICQALNSTFGIIIQGLFGLIQLISSPVSIPAAVAVNGGIVASLKLYVIPELIKLFTPFGINGQEPGVEWVNNAGTGLNLSSNDYARSIGAQPVTMATADKVTAAANHDRLVAQAHEPWTYRTFSTDNPDSLVSKIALSIPSGKAQLFANISSFITSLPSDLFGHLSTILNPAPVLADSSDQNPGEPLGLTQYTLTDNQINNPAYDPIAIDKYLHTQVCAPDPNSSVLDRDSDDPGQWCATRLAMAGDPYNLSDPAADTSTTDLLHCFVGKYDTASSETSPDSICGTMGNYDYNNMPPKAITDSNVAISYCDYLNNEDPDHDVDCSVIPAQISDDIGKYQMYLLYAHIMQNYDYLSGQSTPPGQSSSTSSSGSSTAGLTNPFPGGWIPNRLDAGFDGTFSGQVVAPFSGTITFAHTGVPTWGGYIEIKADQQPSGIPQSTLYFAEGIAPASGISDGTHVNAGTAIGDAVPSPYGDAYGTTANGAGQIEWGVASDNSTGNMSNPYADALGGTSCSAPGQPAAQAHSMVLAFASWAEQAFGLKTPTQTSCAGAG